MRAGACVPAAEAKLMCDSGEADARVAGEFVRYHPAGKAQVVKMGAKMYIMQHLTSTVIAVPFSPCPSL